MPIVLQCGSLNLLEPSGPVQVCSGIASLLPLPFLSQNHEDGVKYTETCSTDMVYVCNKCVYVVGVIKNLICKNVRDGILQNKGIRHNTIIKYCIARTGMIELLIF